MFFDTAGPATRSGDRPGDATLWLHTAWPEERTVVIKAGGVVDSSTVPRFAEVMRSRLTSTARTVVVDLSSLSFMSTDGVVVLMEARHRALMRAVALVLITGNRVVDRLLRVLDLAEDFTYADTVHSAVAPVVLPHPRVDEPHTADHPDLLTTDRTPTSSTNWD